MARTPKPPFRYYVVLDSDKCRARTVKSREPVEGALFEHEAREHCVDFQRLRNQRVRKLRRRIFTKIRREEKVVMRSAPAFRAFAQKHLQQAVDEKERLRQGIISDFWEDES